MRHAFIRLDPPAAAKPTSIWRAWASQVSYQPEVEPAGPWVDGDHVPAAQPLNYGMHGVADAVGHSLGRDCVVRLGENGFTPDVFFVGRERERSQYEYYFDGAPDLIIEVLHRSHANQDRIFKRSVYEKAGVGEYWIVDPLTRIIDFLRLEATSYRPAHPEADGDYRLRDFPQIIFHPKRLWKAIDDEERPSWAMRDSEGIFTCAAARQDAARRRRSDKGEWFWGKLPFEPRIAGEPTPLRFGEFISWCGRAKFEWIDGKPWIDGSRGARNVLGMLLQSFGLAEAMSLFHPSAWIEARLDWEKREASNEGQKAKWMAKARKAADFLRENHGAKRITLIDDLTCDRQLNAWSDISLVLWDKVEIHDFELYEQLSKAIRFREIDCHSVERLSPADRIALERAGIEL